MQVKFEKNTFKNRLFTMLSVDVRRMRTTLLFYLMTAICFVMPILILVMTTMMDGTVSVDPQTGKETVIEGFKNVWQIIGSASGGETAMAMDLTSMCNINLVFFVVAVYVCIFISQDFTSGYAKNLFTVRAKKTDYVISKTIVCFIASAIMLVAFFIGAMLGGAIVSLPFELVGANIGNVICCLLSKIFMLSIFVAMATLASAIGKSRLWLSLIATLGMGMLLFTMIPMITPLNSGIINVILCAVGAVAFAVGLGAISNLVLNKTSLV